MNGENGPNFLPVDLLLDESQPRRGGRHRFLYMIGLFVLVVMFSTLAQSAGAEVVVRFLSLLLMVGLMIGLAVATLVVARRAQGEQGTLEAIEELIQLRRWPEAAAMVQALLSQPTRSPHARVQGLVYLAAVLARYHRFHDALTVYDHLLEEDVLDPEGTFGLKLGRAMSLLREDRLFDVDRAISELRRLSDGNSAGLALVEIYRDVKTGHPREAIELFDRMREPLRTQLGMRFADAIGLVARAHDLLAQSEPARRHWCDATLLVPAPELARRYPELAAMAAKYPASTPPPEVA